ncbi:MAG: YhdP family phospholipid transporter [Pseudomonadales bacterium]
MFRALRILAWRVAVAIALLLALGLAAGRLGTLWLDEQRANQWLEQLLPGATVAAHGFELSWHRFNPVIRIESLTLGDSRIQGLTIKPDWMESLWRWGPVLRHFGNTDANLRFEQTSSGAWALAGMPSAEGGLDWQTLLEHSDQLMLSAELAFATKQQPSPHLALAIQARNQRASRRWDLQLFDPDCPTRCRLAVDLEERLRVPLLQQASLAMVAATVGDGVRIPAALLGGTALRVSRADVRWDASARDWRTYAKGMADRGTKQEPIAGRLEVDLAIADITLPGGRPFDLTVSARGSSHPGYALARSFDAVVTHDGETLALPEFWLRWLPGRLQLYAPRFDLRAALAQAGRSRLPDDVIGQWLRALAIEGELSGLQGQHDLTAGHWSWRAQLRRGAMTGHQGAPTADALSGQLFGYERGLRANIHASASTVGFPGVFNDLWPVRDLQAELELHWRTKFLVLLGRKLDAELVQGDVSAPHLHGTFRLAVPGDRLEQTLALQLNTTQLSMNTIKRFLPSKLNPGLRRWLLTAPQDGLVNDVRMGFMGYVRNRQAPNTRRMAMLGTLAQSSIRFDERWPSVSQLAGEFEISGQAASMYLSHGMSEGVALAGTRIQIPARAGRVELSLVSEFDGADGLKYIRRSPLLQSLPFIEPDWTAAGAMKVDGAVSIPLGEVSPSNPIKTDLGIRLVNVDLQIPSLRTALSGLNGPLRMQTPRLLSGGDIGGALNGQALQFDVASSHDEIAFAFRGTSVPMQVYELLGLSDPGFASGQTQYSGTLKFPTPLPDGASSAPVLSVQTDLAGIALDLPGELGKDAEDLRLTEVTATFSDPQQHVVLSQAALRASMQMAQGSVVSGEMRLLGEPVAVDAAYIDAVVGAVNSDARGLVVSGTLAELPITAGAAGSLFGDVPVRIGQLNVGSLLADDTNLGAVAIAGSMLGDSMDLHIAGERLAGRVSQTDNQPLVVDLERLQMPETGSRGTPLAELDVRLVTEPDRIREQVSVSTVVELAADPLPISLQAQLPTATVNVAALQFGEEDYGRWSFAMAPEADGIRFTELSALVKGIAIEAPEVFWQQQPNRTQFAGELSAENLAEVLPRLGYAATIETQSSGMQADLSWPGSPVNFNLLSMNGNVDFNAKNGRFIEVESGNNALRIFSLLNFSALAKRMNLDFSDVLGRGISFESLEADVALLDGDLRFRQPMEVTGTGSQFRLSGTVDLDTGALANDMIVTLPLSKGLPWYAAYVAIANPLAGLGVLVGERVLAKPLEQLSSARYRITGTLENPKAKLVKVFENKMEAELPVDKQAAASTEEPSE